MKKTVSYSKSQLLDDLGRLALMVLASVIMAVNLKSFVQAGDLVPGGFNGLTLLIQRVALRFWGLSVPFSAINFQAFRLRPDLSGREQDQLQTHRQAVHPVLLRGHPVHQPAH